MKTTAMKLLLILIAALCLAHSAAADTFVVNSTGDSSDGVCNAANCTLREAIEAANASPGADRIEFNLIPPIGVYTISPTSALPDITGPVTIDGYTQGGASENTLAVGNDAVFQIELEGSNAGATSGLSILASNCTIRGLVVNRFTGSGINLGLNSEDNLIEGNFLGTDPSGTLAMPNTLSGVTILDANNVIGGVTPAARNLISGNGSNGISEVFVATGTQIMGNYIGTDRDGANALGNAGSGIALGLGDEIIGGTSPGAGNVLSGNGEFGLAIASSDNLVQGNFIGTSATGTDAVPNQMHGVFISGSAAEGNNNLIGGTTVGARNLISGNIFDGVRIDEGATGNLVRGNFIGTEATGTAGLRNSQNGVVINDSPGNTIGGSIPAAGNVISGNGAYGVAVSLTGATGNVVQGNFIGTDLSRTGAIGNGFTGVLLSASNTLLGGLAGAGNTVAFNQQGGIRSFRDCRRE